MVVGAFFMLRFEYTLSEKIHWFLTVLVWFLNGLFHSIPYNWNGIAYMRRGGRLQPARQEPTEFEA